MREVQGVLRLFGGSLTIPSVVSFFSIFSTEFINCHSHEFVIQLLSFGWYENLNDTESINDLGKPS
jgi:hypothetical protein